MQNSGRSRDTSRRGAITVAIGFLNSYANHAHERRAAAVAEEVFGRARTSVRLDQPRDQEYERFSTAAVNAVLLPSSATTSTRSRPGSMSGFQGEFFVMQCTAA